ncbi:MAG: hypothetical protein IJ036_01795 [Lachnospiraceae bacterium]|nr:hypothetical protein [Lachnospiraceae bacterium]
MLNEEKVKLMTKAAAYESHGGKEALSVNEYFREDYISKNLIWSWIYYTLAYLLCAGLWAVYNMEYLMENIHKMDLPTFIIGLVVIYVTGLIAYLVIAYLYYGKKHKSSRRSLGDYYRILRKISGYYEAEEKTGSKSHTSEGIWQDEEFTGI